MREWCLGIMEAEQNSIFIKRVSEWLGGISFSEMNKRLPEVATAIKQHDTTGMAETFEQISNRLKELLISVGSVYPDGSNILVVTHAFLMKTVAYLFDYENIGNLSKIGNADRMKLLFDKPHGFGRGFAELDNSMFTNYSGNVLSSPKGLI